MIEFLLDRSGYLVAHEGFPACLYVALSARIWLMSLGGNEWVPGAGHDSAVSKSATLGTGGKRVEGPFGPGGVVYSKDPQRAQVTTPMFPGRAAGAVQVVSSCTRQNGCPAGSA